MSKSWSIGWLALSSLLFLCACGGGGGGGTSGSTVGISFTPISVNTPQGFSQAFSFTATATGTVSQTLYPVLTDSQGVTDGTVSVNTLSELQYQVNLNTSCLLTQATHSGNFTLQPELVAACGRASFRTT